MTKKMMEIGRMVAWVTKAIRIHGPIPGYVESKELLTREFELLDRRG